MNKLIKILVVYPIDPFGESIGGISTFLRNFVKYAPDYFDIEWVGISSNMEKRPIGKWHKGRLGDKEFKFLPILYKSEENIRSKIPLSLKFTLALLKNRSKISLEDKILEFHRIEPSMVFGRTNNKGVLFVHGDVRDLYNPHTEIKWGRFPWLYFQIEKLLIAHMDRVFVVTEEGVNFYKDKYPLMENRFSFLPTFADPDIFYPYYDTNEREGQKLHFLNMQNLPINSKLILFVGRLEGAKDPLLLIETFNYVNKNDPNSILLIVGDGALKKEMMMKVAQYKLDSKVHFMGTLPQEKVAEIMRISYVFLLTSAFEGMPMSVLEALASGLPVVSTDVGEVKRVVRDGFSGLVSTKREADILANLVLEVLDKREQFNTNNCIRNVENYTVERVLTKIYEIHNEL